MIYILLFWTFLKIGAFSFGGGYAMISPVQEAVVQHGWMDADTFMKFLGVCESTPGPLMINMATYVGSTQGGLLGAFCATLGSILPSIVIMLLLSTILKTFQENHVVKSVLECIRPAALGLILATGLWMLYTLVLPTGFAPLAVDWKSLVLTGVLLAVPPLYHRWKQKKFSAIALIGISAVFGILLF